MNSGFFIYFLLCTWILGSTSSSSRDSESSSDLLSFSVSFILIADVIRLFLAEQSGCLSGITGSDDPRGAAYLLSNHQYIQKTRLTEKHTIFPRIQNTLNLPRHKHTHKTPADTRMRGARALSLAKILPAPSGTKTRCPEWGSLQFTHTHTHWGSVILVLFIYYNSIY